MVHLALSIGRSPDARIFAKPDDIAGAKEIDPLGIPWEHVRTLEITSEAYRDHIRKVSETPADYEIDGLVMPDVEV